MFGEPLNPKDGETPRGAATDRFRTPESVIENPSGKPLKSPLPGFARDKDGSKK